MVVADVTDYMTIGEFIDAGYLQEVNRLVLHPAGLALEVTITPTTDPTTFTARVWDYRSDPEGVAFGPGVISTEKIRNVLDEQGRHFLPRMQMFGDQGYDPDDPCAVVQLPEGP